ncbi:Phosphoserine phosphatase [Methanosarcina lacustris Z-7289]|uniref:Phosphoserine phosphatase n=1 Tax=Methanosarcina lacustris Z-7289 TaxID=1434111 RepID=A0A0E3S127_9EURY|nr:coiled-coil protein [Methanosarcina lacustris]AKB73696.1 Phosphoserine phosphatase [Methanosarcina lacustris Z-7289]
MNNDVSTAETATADLSNLNERELKSKVNELRSRIEKSERQLASIFKELKINRTDIDGLKEKRDSLNKQVKERVAKAQSLRDRRDEINKQIGEYKEKRSNVNSKTQELFTGIADLKEKRDECNKLSHGSVESLSRAYEAELDAFLNKELPLEVEIKILQKLSDLVKRLEAAKKANKLHSQIQDSYKESKGIHKEGDEFHEKIQELSDESQACHLEMLENFKAADEIRKEANMYHAQLTEKIANINSIKEKIDPLKNSITGSRKELSLYLDRLKDLQLTKDEHKVSQKHSDAREKLQKNARLSLEDLKLLIEKGDVKFSTKD